MRSPETVKRELVQKWLSKAEDDFRLINHLISEKNSFLSAIGFHAQQSTEKYIKAILVHHQIEFPKTHDIDQLLDLLQKKDRLLADSLRDSAELVEYGVDIRYPGDSPDITLEEADKAVDLAIKVREIIRKSLTDYI